MTEPVPDPATATPELPGPTIRVPDTTDSVACTTLLPESASPMDRPVPCSISGTCSVAAYDGGVIVAVGASLTAVMAMVEVAVSNRAPPVPAWPWSSMASVRVSAAGGASPATR
ncbi:MAG: hypothetical protein EOP40_13260 [Rubrivivax sp.]|nr:MAG: hypothetical protein EOP40_13260 [Rubrivivax sp.]